MNAPISASTYKKNLLRTLIEKNVIKSELFIKVQLPLNVNYPLLQENYTKIFILHFFHHIFCCIAIFIQLNKLFLHSYPKEITTFAHS